MSIHIQIHLIVFLFATAITLLLTPKVIKLSKSIGALDYPAERSIHVKAVPRLGGLAIFSAFTFSISGYLIYKIFYKSIELNSYWQQNIGIGGILIGALIIFIVGVIDDIYDVSPAFKFGGQIIAAATVVFFGVTIEYLGSPLGQQLISIPAWVGVLLTIFWIVALTNTINFIDGLDGLASGVGVISGSALYYIAAQTGRQDLALALAALIGSLLGFLKYNFNPAKIFMGDSGSMFIGFMLGAITVQSAAKSAATIALLVPIVIMGIPIFDAAYAIWRRFVNRRPLTQADKEHIHHKLLRKGLSHRGTVYVIYGWTLLLSIIGLSITFVHGQLRVIILIVLLIFSFLLAYFSGLLDWSASFHDKNED